MNCTNVAFLIGFLALFFIGPIARAQEQTVVLDSLYSKVLSEERQLHIVLPKNYNPSVTDSYQIVYCLDDITDFLTLEWGMLQWEGFIPKNMIMVGITNPKPNGVDMRDRDFTPTKTTDRSGGAAEFLSFFKTELIPFINRKYKGATTGNVLYGGSLGGLFVLYTFLNEPTLFTSYVAIDPSLWWDNRYVTNIARARLHGLKSANNTLFIAGRQGNAYNEMGIADFNSVLKVKAPAGLDWTCVQYANETHYSTNLKGFWDGLKFSYGGFYASTGGYATSRKIALKPKRGLVLKDRPFKLICYNLMADTYLHYTIDGTKPTRSSPRLRGEETPIALQKSAKVIVKSIGQREAYNRLDSCYFEAGAVFPSIPKPKGVEPGGLQYAYYEGEGETLSTLTNKKAVQSGLADKRFDVTTLSTTQSFACLLTGYIEIKESGYYIFEMGNKDTNVYLNDQKILGGHPDDEVYLIPLAKGFYPFRIDYFHKKGDGNLVPIYLKPEGVEDFPIPVDMLYSRRLRN